VGESTTGSVCGGKRRHKRGDHFYAIAYPKVRLGIMFRYFVYIRWLRISAVWALVLYLLLQLFGAWAQINGFGDVSYLGHLGGLVVGICAGLLYKARQKREALRRNQVEFPF